MSSRSSSDLFNMSREECLAHCDDVWAEFAEAATQVMYSSAGLVSENNSNNDTSVRSAGGRRRHSRRPTPATPRLRSQHYTRINWAVSLDSPRPSGDHFSADRLYRSLRDWIIVDQAGAMSVEVGQALAAATTTTTAGVRGRSSSRAGSLSSPVSNTRKRGREEEDSERLCRSSTPTTEQQQQQQREPTAGQLLVDGAPLSRAVADVFQAIADTYWEFKAGCVFARASFSSVERSTHYLTRHGFETINMLMVKGLCGAIPLDTMLRRGYFDPVKLNALLFHPPAPPSRSSSSSHGNNDDDTEGEAVDADDAETREATDEPHVAFRELWVALVDFAETVTGDTSVFDNTYEDPHILMAPSATSDDGARASYPALLGYSFWQQWLQGRQHDDEGHFTARAETRRVRAIATADALDVYTLIRTVLLAPFSALLITGGSSSSPDGEEECGPYARKLARVMSWVIGEDGSASTAICKQLDRAQRLLHKMSNFLLSDGNCMNDKSEPFMQPIEFAARIGHCAAIKRLLANGVAATTTVALRAVGGDQQRALDILLEDGNVDPSVVCCSYKRTLLHYAAEGGFSRAAQSLVSHGAPVLAVNAAGRTPLEVVPGGSIDVYRNMVPLLVWAGHSRPLFMMLIPESWVPALCNDRAVYNIPATGGLSRLCVSEDVLWMCNAWLMGTTPWSPPALQLPGYTA